jgi:hypothetical protein
MKLISAGPHVFDMEKVDFTTYEVPTSGGKPTLTVTFVSGQKLLIESPHAGEFRDYLKGLSHPVDRFLSYRRSPLNARDMDLTIMRAPMRYSREPSPADWLRFKDLGDKKDEKE